MQKLWAVPFLLGLAACAPTSDPAPVASGVGFGNYSDYIQQTIKREKAQKEAQQAAVTPGPTAPDTTTTTAANSAPATTAAQDSSSAPKSSVNPLPPVPDNSPLVAPGQEASSIWDTPITAPAAQPPEGSDKVTDENSFSRVTAERTRRQDAERLMRNREQYVIIEPTDLPKRPGTNMPNIVAYALKTTNPVGTQLYKRSPLNTKSGSERACARYVSPDLAQEAFLAAGGPKKDPKNLDPDGDGFACTWDPTVFRAAVR